ncbi:GNAT family N-acetyltransferase [Nocardia sp. GAS34]|uniref:GNAT family N-acetyltransferase n=1 Tax=Nocardia sp. GAS34 TaxID=3156305 RepID=UPI003D1EF115
MDGHAHGGFVHRLEVALAALRPDVAVRIHNHGRSGATSRDLVMVIEHADLEQDLALIECGTNDVLRRYQPGREHDAVDIEEFTRNYRTILDTLAARSRRVLCLCAPPVHPAILADAEQINRDLFACNLAARAAARDTGAVFVDYWGKFTATAALLREQNTSTTSTPSPWAADGIHLSPIGTELILRSIENTLLDKNVIATLLPRPVSTTNTTDVVIRAARLEDIPAAVRLHADVAAEERWVGAEPPVDEADAADGLERLMTATGTAVFVGDHPRVGVVASATVYFVAAGVAELTMMVAAGHRHHGIGTALLDKLMDWCRTHQAHKLTLQVWPHNLPAIALYHRAGFDTEGTLRAHYRRRNGELWDAIVMGRLL